MFRSFLRLTLVALCTLSASRLAHADVYNWYTGTVIPGTEGIDPVPGVQLDEMDLAFADLRSRDLTDANFHASNLHSADLRARLVNANLRDADLTGARLFTAVTGADITGAVVTGTYFSDTATTGRGLTKEQLYSTASYQGQNLHGIRLVGNDLSGWDFSNQDLTDAELNSSILTDTDLTGAVVAEAHFYRTTSRGFTKEQLYSTASYRQKNLQGMLLSENDLTGWDFSGQNLAAVSFHDSTMSNTNLTDARVAGADFQRTTSLGFNKEQLYATRSYRQKTLQGVNLGENDLTSWDFAGQDLTNASFAKATLKNITLDGAIVNGASFAGVLDGFHMGLVYSTASYQARSLRGVDLSGNTLAGGNFHSQDLTNADLSSTTLTHADLTAATVMGTRFWETTSRGFTKEQLYSTSSYQQKNLQGVGLVSNDLSGWDFSGQDLRDADLSYSTLSAVDLTDAVVTGARLRKTTALGFAKEQLYATASYQRKNLQGIALGDNDLTGWDFSQQDLSWSFFADPPDIRRAATLADADVSYANLNGAWLGQADLTGANLVGAKLTNVNLSYATLTGVRVDSATVYDQWTVFPDGFDAQAAGMTFVPTRIGDFDANDKLDVVDIDRLTSLMGAFLGSSIFPNAVLDLDRDAYVTEEDHRIWVKDLKKTWFGDANLDNEFNTADFVQVFTAGKYELTQREGDWNGDGLFDTSDFVIAFQDGGYELGPRNIEAPVPEPEPVVLFFTSIVLLLLHGRRKNA